MTEPNKQIEHRITHRGQSVPTLVYGTAWKEDRTEALVRLALETGFTGIDTANQRKHYNEEGVGKAVKSAIADGLISRDRLFLQSKFTYINGQDHRVPYDPEADCATQVKQSFASSLEHLGTDYLDSYVLHGPAGRVGLTQSDREVWRAMEALQQSGAVRQLGVSNVNIGQLQELLGFASVRPAFVQNRCYAQSGWDEQVRELCRSHDMLYQGFSLLTANNHVLDQPEIHALAARYGCTMQRVVFRFALQLGMMPLTGTSQAAHMQEDLGAYEIVLDEADVKTLTYIAR